MISSYFDLARSVLSVYVSNSYQEKKETVSTSQNHEQWAVGSITLTISEISPSMTLISFVHGSDAQAISVNWSDFKVKLPIEGPLEQLQLQFDAFMDLKLGSSSQRQLQEDAQRGADPERTPVAPLVSRVSHPSDNWVRAEPKAPPADMPGFDDEYEVLRPANGQQGPLGLGLTPIGDGDLNPPGLPRYPEMRPYLDPLANPQGGMHPSMQHPLFGRAAGNSSRTGVPPGARYDDPFGEDNLSDMGMGLPGNLRQGPGSGFGGPGFGSGGSSGLGGNFGF